MSKWTQDYDWESVIDFFADDHFEDALDEILPHPQAEGIIRITIEYIPEGELEDE